MDHMQVLRILFAALLAVAAVVAGLFTAAVVAVVGLVAWLVLLFKQKQGFPRQPRTRPAAAPRHTSMSGTDAIEVETSVVEEGGGRVENRIP